MKLLLPALFALFLLSPTAVHAATAYATDDLYLRAGPDGRYPSVGVVREDERVELYGCAASEQWCEIKTRDGERGWVAAYYLRAATLTGQRLTIIETRESGGLRIILFNPHDYWDRHYRNKYFYKDRDKWIGRPQWSHDHNADHGDHHVRPEKPRPAEIKTEPKYKKMETPSRKAYNPLCRMGQTDC